MKGIPIGVQDFKAIRDADGYFVDKSALIDDILSRRLTGVFLFTRPRRFGKSVNLSMLDAYLNIRYKGNSWFDGLQISDMRPMDPEKNSRPVIVLDMKELGTDSMDVFTEDLRFSVAEVCKRFPELAGSEKQDPDDMELFRRFKSMSSGTEVLRRSLRLITRMLEVEYGVKPVLLIDEYDSPINNSYGKPFQHDILNVVRDMMSSVLKGNDSLRFGVVTGVMQITKGSIFSGLNNLTVNCILSRDMDERFGFTPDEVEGICRDYGHPEKYPEAREWYDGYRFGDAEIYNPWSILNYVSNGFTPGAYWAGTSGNSVVDDLLSSPDRKTHDDLMVLGRGGSVEATIDPGQTFTDISSGTPGVYGVLAMSGYLRAVPSGGGYSLSIPNREMYGVFGDAVVSRLGGTGMVPTLRSLSKALLSGDEDETGRCIGDLLKDAVSSRVLDDEHSYQASLAGLLMNLYGCYSVTADHESGEGYHDIRLERIRGDGPNVVIELKRTRRGEDPRQLAEDALGQIVERGYAHGLKGRTILYGIAFESKTPTVVSRTIG